MITKDLGTVTAYAYAVAGGYTGTEEEFAELLGNIAIDLSEIENLSVTITTLPAGSSATASYSNGVLSLGIPKGDKGDKGNTGATGATGATGNGIASVTKTGTSGLVDTYTITFTNGSTTTFTVTNGQDGEVTEAALESTLESYAKIDGSYDNLTAGNAKQLVSTVRANDKVPYNFRPSGGSVDIGDREYINGIVGGTVAWNQLVKNGNFADTTGWSPVRTSLSASNNVLTATVTEVANHMVANRVDQVHSIVSGHKYLISVQVKPPRNTTFTLAAFSTSGDNHSISANADVWSNIATVSTVASVTTGTWGFRVGFNSQTDGYSVNDAIQLKNFNVFDLTQMFGPTIADYIYSLEQNTAGAGVAWFKKLFNKPYYAYNAGELKHVSGLVSHDMTGFNQLVSSENTSNTTAYSVALKGTLGHKLIAGTTYCISFDVTNVPSGGRSVYVNEYLGIHNNANVYITVPSNGHYYATFEARDYDSVSNIALLKYGGATTQALQFSNVCINLSWDGSRNGEYEPYELHSYPLDSDLTLRGIPKLDANNNLYYDGDTYESDGTVTRKYKAVTIDGSNAFSYQYNGTLPSGYIACFINFADKAYGIYNMISDKFEGNNDESLSTMCGRTNNSGIQFVLPSTVTASNAGCKAWFESNPTGLVYELATPTTETADPYQSPQIVDDFGTEEYVDTRDVAIPVGHDTDYPINILAKVEMAPNSPDGDGDYIVRQTNGENAYVPLVIEDALPTMPSTAGEYRLIVTIADGEDPVLSWEANE